MANPQIMYTQLKKRSQKLQLLDTPYLLEHHIEILGYFNYIYHRRKAAVVILKHILNRDLIVWGHV